MVWVKKKTKRKKEEGEMKQFKLDLNLDDAVECEQFLAQYGTTKGRRLANLLGLSGRGSARLASALSNYAWNAHTARVCRESGKTSVVYEVTADRIYKNDIQPVCECW
jgi:hypothetical protein